MLLHPTGLEYQTRKSCPKYYLAKPVELNSKSFQSLVKNTWKIEDGFLLFYAICMYNLC